MDSYILEMRSLSQAQVLWRMFYTSVRDNQCGDFVNWPQELSLRLFICDVQLSQVIQPISKAAVATGGFPLIYYFLVIFIMQ